jgi:hypothetical protein
MDMDTAKHCRDQAAECFRLMSLARSEAEARALQSLSQSWVRIANQTERYALMTKGKTNMQSVPRPDPINLRSSC